MNVREAANVRVPLWFAYVFLLAGLVLGTWMQAMADAERRGHVLSLAQHVVFLAPVPVLLGWSWVGTLYARQARRLAA